MFNAVSPSLFFSKNDPQDQRLGDVAKALSSVQLASSYAQPLAAVLGYPDDEGIKNNGGRVGSSQAPDRIRKFLYRLTPPQSSLAQPLLDLGNLDITRDLSTRHEQAKLTVQALLEQNIKTLSFGGGHDYGYPDAAAFLKTCQIQNLIDPLVINFDAHLDVRPVSEKISSGTPFFRLLKDFKDFDFVEVGLQKLCNSPQHIEWLKSNRGHAIFLEDVHQAAFDKSINVSSALKAALSPFIRERPCFISVDIDVFSQSVAPGCSQSWPYGLLPNDFFPIFDWILKQTTPLGMGIYEVSPPLDSDDRTSKLAAQIAYAFLFH